MTNQTDLPTGEEDSNPIRPASLPSLSGGSTLPTGEEDSNPIRPDPMFKDVTRKEAQAAGLELLNIEMPQLLRADLVLAVPQGIDLTGTLFEFLAPYSIIEFKSENDTFDKSEFAKNLARTFLFFSENQPLEYSQLLTVFVSAGQPDSVIDHLRAEGTTLEPDPAYPWLMRCRIWSLEVAIVVCRLLPLERRYYNWLLFAPVGSTKWREFVKILLRDGEWTMLELIKKLRLREYRLMTLELAIADDLEGLTPKEREERLEDWVEVIVAEFNMLEHWDQEKASEAASKWKPETLLGKLSPKQILEVLSPEQMLAVLSPEQRLAGLTPEQMLAGLTPEQIATLSPEDRQRFRELFS
ncbi:MAG: hypothetical protein HXX20_01100 [Chloroflexi bacterium]|nr:hypothetical protein [Chloroflexota bacterium]